ncbi:DNA-binding transcriptional regulator, LysR family [Jhaorihella thermophila]|uniref:DNA-binding transcriptional regulator, LysR family n=1 Tax=Jhaorihella thermophila TaxID=488547 RepID=A0A1H5VIS5_9RHOB|nr:DNA-binding transcriptional regulator, LysR family [Jhaorihella thermophila]
MLDALLQTCSTTAAGRQIGLSQPAVSAALGRLRHALGAPLFVRQGRRLVPTGHALTLRDPLRDLLENTESLLSGAAPFDPATAEDVFRISGSDFYAEFLMPQLADHLSRAAPFMQVHLVDLVPDRYLDTIDRYDVDMAMIPGTTFPPWIDHRPLHRSRFVVMDRLGHPKLKTAHVRPGEAIPLDVYCDVHHILFSPEGKSHGIGDEALARVGRERRVVMTLPVFSGVCRAVAQSDLIALIPEQLARRVAPVLGLSIHAPPMEVPEASLALVWHRRATRTPAHRWLRDQIAMLLAPLDTPAV